MAKPPPVDRCWRLPALRRRLMPLVLGFLVVGCGQDALPGATPGPASRDGGQAPPTAPPPLALDRDLVAQRLSRLLWDQLPDPRFVAQVRAAAPASASQVGALALQMLQDPRARPGLAAFYRWWLGTDAILLRAKDPTLFPMFTPALQQAMAAEGPAFGVHVTLDTDHRFVTLMTAPQSLIDETLAGVYGVAGVSGPALRLTALNAAQRAGLLTQPGLLAVGASATNPSASARGYRILGTFLCVPVPDAPGEAAGEPPDTTTNRAWIQSNTANGTCKPCHAFTDPIGFGLGNFDAIGRFSTTEHGLPVDATGWLTSSGTDPAPAFDGPVELGARMAESPKAQSCFVSKWLRFAVGRELTPADQPSHDAALARFTDSGFDIQALIGAVAASDSFLAP